MAVAADAGGLAFGNYGGAVSCTFFAINASRQRCRILHGGGCDLQAVDHRSSRRKLRSTARAEWVMAPEETKSAPVSA